MWILNRAAASRSSSAARARGGPGRPDLAARKAHDWIAPFYRSIATCPPSDERPELMLAQYAKRSILVGGRQMPGHYGHPSHHLVSVSSPVATQILHAVGIALAAKIAVPTRWAVAIMGEGEQQPGRRPEALNFARSRLPFVFIVENNGYAISVPARSSSRRRPRLAGVRLRHAGRGRGRHRRARLYAAGARRSSGTRRWRPDADRGQGDPLTAHSSDDSRRCTAPRTTWPRAGRTTAADLPRRLREGAC